MNEIRRRLIGALAFLVFATFLGAAGFWSVGDGRWTFWECAYMSIVSATTVGFGETLDGMHEVPAARIWAVVVILMGVGTFGYAASMLTAFLVENDLRATFRKRAMMKRIEDLKDHVIVCGAGSTGRHVVHELVATRTPCVVIEADAKHMDELVVELAPANVLHIVGDATDDGVLEKAGVARARGVVAALPDDKDNLYVVVSSRGANPNVRIVSRGHTLRIAEKLKKAGANAVVSPNYIGGLRLASEMVRPHVVEFLDQMVRDKDRNLRVDEVDVTERAPVAGKSLRDSHLRDVTEALVLAVRDQKDRKFSYNPGPDSVLTAGTTLVVLGTVDAVEKLRAFLDPSRPPA